MKRKPVKYSIVKKKESGSIKRIFKRTKTIIKIVAWTLAASFTWLELYHLPIFPMLTDRFSSVFLKIIIAIYYISWIAGPLKDLEDEEYVLLIAPNKGKLTILAIVTILTLGVLFGWLCLAHTYQEFAIA